MSSIERGERATTKPTIALEDVRIHVKERERRRTVELDFRMFVGDLLLLRFRGRDIISQRLQGRY
jgi:hypothetical protein